LGLSTSKILARNLEKILRERNVEIAALKSRLSSEVNEPESLDLIGTPPPKIPSPIFSEIPYDLLETIFLLKKELITLAGQEVNSIKDDGIEHKQKFSKQKSFSDSDINSCEEYFSNKRLLSGYQSHDSQLASLASSTDSHCMASSTNSMSHYGSENAMDLYARAEQIHSSLSLHSHSLAAGMVEEESYGSGEDPDIMWDSKDPSRNKKKLGRRYSSQFKYDGSKKSRRTSSDNVSTPASNRSRSQSIMSTGDEQDEVLLEDDSMENAQTSEIDKILELVDELKQKDLDEYKRKINLKKQAPNGAEIEHCHDNNLHHTDFMDENINIELKNVDEVSDFNVKDTCQGALVDPNNTEDMETNKHFDLDALVVPTKRIKIQPVEEAPRLTRDIQSLVIKTFPCRIYAPTSEQPPASPSQPEQQTIKRNIIVKPAVSSTAWTAPLISSAASSSSYSTPHVGPINSISKTSKKEQISTKEETKDDCQHYKIMEEALTDGGQKPKEKIKQGIMMDESTDASEPKTVKQQLSSPLFEKENSQKKDAEDSVEPAKKFSTKFQGPHLKIVPDRELNQGYYNTINLQHAV